MVDTVSSSGLIIHNHPDDLKLFFKTFANIVESDPDILNEWSDIFDYPACVPVKPVKIDQKKLRLMKVRRKNYNLGRKPKARIKKETPLNVIPVNNGQENSFKIHIKKVNNETSEKEKKVIPKRQPVPNSTIIADIISESCTKKVKPKKSQQQINSKFNEKQPLKPSKASGGPKNTTKSLSSLSHLVSSPLKNQYSCKQTSENSLSKSPLKPISTRSPSKVPSIETSLQCPPINVNSCNNPTPSEKVLIPKPINELVTQSSSEKPAETTGPAKLKFTKYKIPKKPKIQEPLQPRPKPQATGLIRVDLRIKEDNENLPDINDINIDENISVDIYGDDSGDPLCTSLDAILSKLEESPSSPDASQELNTQLDEDLYEERSQLNSDFNYSILFDESESSDDDVSFKRKRKPATERFIPSGYNYINHR